MALSDEAVGGFFEDLPVLMFVLFGVFLLVSTSLFASGQIAEERRHGWIEGVADDLMAAIMSRVNAADAVGSTVTMASMREMDLGRIASAAVPDVRYCVSLVALHPHTEWLCSAISGDPSSATSTGIARSLFNALCDDGMIGVVEVTVLVW